MRRVLIAGIVLLTGLLSTTARAGIIKATGNSGLPLVSSPVYVGGPLDVQAAQPLLWRVSGPLREIRLGIRCQPFSAGLVTIDVRTTYADTSPTDVVLAATSVDVSTLPRGDMFPTSKIRVPMLGPVMDSGQTYAVTIRTEPGVSCDVQQGYNATNGGHWGRSGSSRIWNVGYTTLPLLIDAYVRVVVPTRPRYCDVHDTGGVPNDWIYNHVPICGCLEDSTMRASRCWFATPEFIAWREFDLDALGKDGHMRWSVVPLRHPFSGLNVQEFGIDGDLQVEPLQFDAQSLPGTAQGLNAEFSGGATRSKIEFEFEMNGEPARIQFETQLDLPHAQD